MFIKTTTYQARDFFGDRKWEEQSKNPDFIFEILKNPINAIKPSKRHMRILKTSSHRIAIRSKSK